MRTLIIPACSRFATETPYPIMTDHMGEINCVRALKNLSSYKSFDKIYFVVVKAEAEKYDLENRIIYQCRHVPNVEVIILDDYTRSEPETVYKAIQKKHIEGFIFIKDAVSIFDTEIIEDNSVYTYNLEAMKRIIPGTLSYVKVDELNTINTICEKKVISNQFCAGGYGFKSAAEFCEYFLKWKTVCQDKSSENFYISHIIFDMILHNNLFEAQKVKNLIFIKE